MNDRDFKHNTFKHNTFKVLGLIADIYYKNPELKKYFDLWITESTENGSEQISLTIREKEE